MFNALYPNVYRKLRKRAGLIQEELGTALGISRYTVGKVEAGRAWYDDEQERALCRLANCGYVEFGELLCEELSKLLGKKVGIEDSDAAYVPSTALALANAMLREQGESFPAEMRQRLSNRISTTQFLGYAVDRNNAELVELTQECRVALKPRRRKDTMPRDHA